MIEIVEDLPPLSTKTNVTLDSEAISSVQELQEGQTIKIPRKHWLRQDEGVGPLEVSASARLVAKKAGYKASIRCSEEAVYVKYLEALE